MQEGRFGLAAGMLRYCISESQHLGMHNMPSRDSGNGMVLEADFQEDDL